MISRVIHSYQNLPCIMWDEVEVKGKPWSVLQQPLKYMEAMEVIKLESLLVPC